MDFKVPWLISRRRKIVAIAIDFLIVNVIYNINYSNLLALIQI